MADQLAPLFESRETRLGRLPAEARTKFEALTTGAADPEMADRLFVSVWLSQKTGVPRRQVLDSFDGVASKFFGEGVTPSQAYDRIAASYRQPAEPTAEPGTEPAEAEYSETAGLPKAGRHGLLFNVEQSGRAAGSGFTGFAQRVPAGLYSQAAAVTGAPTLRDPMEIPEYAALKKQNAKLENPYQFTEVSSSEINTMSGAMAEADTALMVENDAKMAAIVKKLNEEHLAAVTEWRKTPQAGVSQEYRRLADFWYEVAKDAPTSFGVDPSFQKTTLGKFMTSAGSVPATAALAVMGPAGLAGLESSFFADVEQERMQAEGAAYNPDKALTANLASALPQMALERAFGVERLLNNVLGEVPKLAGKVRFVDFAKQFVKQGLTAAIEEGLTEPTQGFWNDYVASISYDEKRELLTGEGAKRRLVESVSGFALGFLFGGGVAAVDMADQARAAPAEPRFVTAKDGELMGPPDFKALREAKTDAELLASAPDETSGMLLVAAVNGDLQAQVAYNSQVTAALFKDTEGMSAAGMTISQVAGVPVVQMADGVTIPINLSNPEEAAFLADLQALAVEEAAPGETQGFVTDLEAKVAKAGQDLNGQPEARKEAQASPEAAPAAVVSQTDQAFVATGVPMTRQQALQARGEGIRATKLSAAAALEARLAVGSVPKAATAVRRSTGGSLAARILVPINTRVAAMSPELGQRLRRFEFDSGQVMMAAFKRVTPFANGVERMTDADGARLDLALKNGDTRTRDTVLARYGLEKAFADVEAVIEETRKRAEAVGYKVEKIEDYFPRKVNDLDGLLMHYYGEPEAGKLEAAIKQAVANAAAQGRTLTDEERAAVVNNALRGFKPKETRPSNTKDRTTDVVTVEASAYYASSVEALAHYLTQMNEAIAKREFFGRMAVTMAPATESDGHALGLNVDASVGVYVNEMIEAGKLDRSQQQELQSILEARFNQRAVSPFVKAYKTLTYMATLGQITSAITQLGDLAYSIYENGVYDTLVAAGQAAAGKSKVTKESLGIEAISEEFRDPGKMAKALDRIFRITGMHYLDRVGKETVVNGKLRQIKREAESTKLGPKTRAILEASFTPEEQAEVFADLAAGKKTEDTMFVAYSVLAGYQPINASEFPEAYLRHPNGRVFYALKSFTLKQIDAFRNEALTLIVNGSAKQKATGFKNLLQLAGLLYVAGMSTDWLKDWLMGRKPRMEDIALDNVFKLMALNRWVVWKFREDPDPVKAAMLLVAPPAPFLQYPLEDLKKIAEQISKGDDVKLGELESLRLLPVVGAPAYWWTGGGEAKVQARERRQKKKSNYAWR